MVKYRESTKDKQAIEIVDEPLDNLKWTTPVLNCAVCGKPCLNGGFTDSTCLFHFDTPECAMRWLKDHT